LSLGTWEISTRPCEQHGFSFEQIAFNLPSFHGARKMTFSRRRFLEAGGMAAAAMAAPRLASAQQPEAPKLPEPIAKLKSRKSEAKPITADERRQRLERARQLVAVNKLDAILIMSGTSLVYFTGIRWFQSE